MDPEFLMEIMELNEELAAVTDPRKMEKIKTKNTAILERLRRYEYFLTLLFNHLFQMKLRFEVFFPTSCFILVMVAHVAVPIVIYSR